jgi:hypothetical protein
MDATSGAEHDNTSEKKVHFDEMRMMMMSAYTIGKISKIK